MKRLLALFLTFIIAVGASGAVAHDGHDHGTPDASPMADHDHGHGHGDESLSMGAGYLEITNNGDEDDVLISATTDAAEVVEVHEVVMEDSVMQMSPLHDGLPIPAGETVVLEPGGYHIMLIGLTESLIAGEDYEITLTFENAGDVTVTVPILRTEPDDDDEKADAVEAGDITVDGAWSRQAPKIDGPSGTPVASPEATPGS